MSAANFFLMDIKDKIPSKALLPLQQSLKQVDERVVQKLYFISFKSPMIAIILSLFVGVLGVDRFYKGDIKLGLAKIALFLISCIILITTIITAANELKEHLLSLPMANPFYQKLLLEAQSYEQLPEFIISNAYLNSFIIGFLGVLISYIWWIVDIFLVFFGVKKDNLNKIFQLIKA